MKVDLRKQRGSYGEFLVEEHLRENGFVILARNFRCGKQGEIDLVAKMSGKLYLVEVKFKKAPPCGRVFSQRQWRRLQVMGRFVGAWHPKSEIVFLLVHVDPTTRAFSSVENPIF